VVVPALQLGHDLGVGKVHGVKECTRLNHIVYAACVTQGDEVNLVILRGTSKLK
jgi:hypothetical protein